MPVIGNPFPKTGNTLPVSSFVLLQDFAWRHRIALCRRALSSKGRGASSVGEWKLANPRSRAYKLQLSQSGIHLFLRCHGRLCGTVGDFLPYGSTLFVAASLLRLCPEQDLPGELLAPDIEAYGGRLVRYVGTSPTLSGLVQEIARRLEESGLVHPAPQTWKIFLAALNHMETASDQELLRTFCAVAGEIGRPPGRMGNP
ncbi:hypothetical protein [Novosphingobium humi]|uniref:Uncharacterized protein n=1 Tax=Novosphingobium humi TaxID=2282397 RepID=A0ABY7U2I6_9SPHN|nr:hypothetical protein [Novosphingobium humi]WCT79107.1 hypothetical protein PQ457_19020 [Novosphingobium humi]